MLKVKIERDFTALLLTNDNRQQDLRKTSCRSAEKLNVERADSDIQTFIFNISERHNGDHCALVI